MDHFQIFLGHLYWSTKSALEQLHTRGTWLIIVPGKGINSILHIQIIKQILNEIKKISQQDAK